MMMTMGVTIMNENNDVCAENVAACNKCDADIRRCDNCGAYVVFESTDQPPGGCPKTGGGQRLHEFDMCGVCFGTFCPACMSDNGDTCRRCDETREPHEYDLSALFGSEDDTPDPGIPEPIDEGGALYPEYGEGYIHHHDDPFATGATGNSGFMRNLRRIFTPEEHAEAHGWPVSLARRRTFVWDSEPTPSWARQADDQDHPDGPGMHTAVGGQRGEGRTRSIIENGMFGRMVGRDDNISADEATRMLTEDMIHRDGMLDTSQELGHLMDWSSWREGIPFIRFPKTWHIKVIPPSGGAVVRFLTMNKGNIISVFLDCYDLLGSLEPVTNFGQPYWEIYPDSRGDASRFHIDDITGLLTEMRKSFRKMDRDASRIYHAAGSGELIAPRIAEHANHGG